MSDVQGFGRRRFLVGAGIAAATAAGLVGVSPARADQTVERSATDWRRRLADEYLAEGESFGVRPLQDGLEVWESASGGYMIVESTRQTPLEGSPTSPSPYRAAAGGLAYLGPGAYFAGDGSKSIDLRSGDVSASVEVRAAGRDAVETMRDTLTTSPMDSAAVRRGLGGSGMTASKAADDLPRVKSGDIASRVPSYGYVTGSHVYDNYTGICGWVAGSIVTRYWYARSSARTLLPAAYRSGTNMTSKPNFASYLQGEGGDATWAPNIEERMVWNAKKQKARFVSSWAVGKIGVAAELEAGYPAIIFGNLPTGPKKKGPHAVVAYGLTKGGYPITHYGWLGYTNIVLNGGLIGSNSRFRLT